MLRSEDGEMVSEDGEVVRSEGEVVAIAEKDEVE